MYIYIYIYIHICVFYVGGGVRLPSIGPPTISGTKSTAVELTLEPPPQITRTSSQLLYDVGQLELLAP